MTFKTRITLFITLVIVFFGIVSQMIIEKRILSEMEKELDLRAEFEVRYIASESVDLILYNDLVGLQQLLFKLREAEKNLAYAFVIDNANNILAHTMERDIPASLKYINQADSTGQIKREIISIFNEEFRDYSLQIYGGELGTFRMAVRNGRILEKIDRLRKEILIVFVIMVLFASIGGYALTARMYKPLDTVLETISHYRPGSPVREIPTISKDEIGQLSVKVNDVMRRLNETYTSMIRAEKLASIGTMAAGIAHEINNPISGMRNCLERMKRNPDNVAQTREYSTLMIDSVSQMERVVVGLLDFAHGSRVRKEDIILADTIQAALKLVEHQARQKDIQVKVTSSLGASKLFYGDDGLLRQLIVNLVLNSIDASPDHSVIEVALAGDSEKVAISIHDFGHGIAPADIDSVFDPFFTTKPPGKGTGLGLAVSHKIVQEHFGTIHIDSELNRGTRIRIELPFNQENSQE